MVPLPPPMPAHDSPYYDDQPNYPDRSSLNQDIQNHSFAKHFDPSYPYIKQYEAQSEISFDMNEELKSVIPRFKQKQNYGIPIPKTPMVFIDEKSTENEVQEWLQKKGFSKNVRERMKGLKGSEVMGFDRDELEEEFGKEGKRLASQITLQKEICKYTVSKNSELQGKLAEARKKADASMRKEKIEAKNETVIAKQVDTANDDENEKPDSD